MKNIYNLLNIPEFSSEGEIKNKLLELSLTDEVLYLQAKEEYMEMRKIGKEAYDKRLKFAKRADGIEKYVDNLPELDIEEVNKDYNNPNLKTQQFIKEERPIHIIQEHKPEVPESKIKVSSKLKKGKKYSLTKKGLVGIVVAACLTGFALKPVAEEIWHDYENKVIGVDSNTCVVYEVNLGDSYNYLEETLKFKDLSMIDLVVKDGNRTPGYLYEGDVFVGRTTPEIAKKLEEKGSARIISVEEAIELIDNNKSILKGEFLKASNNEKTKVDFNNEYNKIK